MLNYKIWVGISLMVFIFMSSMLFYVIKIDNLRIENLQKQLIKSHIHKNFQKSVTITAYVPTTNQTDSTPNQTAIMKRPLPGYSCAVSRDLLYLLGKKIYIQNVGVYEVNDLMNKRFNKRVDICIDTNKNAFKFGKKIKNVVIIG